MNGVNLLVGADGCPGGWIAAILDPKSGRIETQVLTTDGLLGLQARVTAIDMPIGLSEDGPRECDLAARRLISPRGSCLFPSPVRGILGCATYPEANARSRELCGKGLPKQSYMILPKIRELDLALRALTEETRERVYETHPEVAFSEMSAKATLGASKHTEAGIALRTRLIGEEFSPEDVAAAMAAHRKKAAKSDDILDAFACLWTAIRIDHGEHRFVTPDVPRDTVGLRMTIAY